MAKQPKTVAAVMEMFEELNSRPYDGLAGQPPDWIPEEMSNRFRSARARLLADDSVEEVQKWLLAQRENNEIIASGEDFFWLSSYPPDHRDDLTLLVHVQDMVSLGREKGTAAHLGEHQYEDLRKAHKSERDQEIDRDHRQQSSKAGKSSGKSREAKRDARINTAARGYNELRQTQEFQMKSPTIPDLKRYLDKKKDTQGWAQSTLKHLTLVAIKARAKKLRSPS